MASTSSDHTVNKIALYSALFAGVAYVGYSYVKDSLGKPRKHKKDEGALLEYENHRRRIFLRRLSGSESSILLGTGSSNGDRSRLVLRPLTVQQRIRELNLRARHFAETIMAVQLADAVPDPTDGRSALNHHGMSFSLQTSPTHSPANPIDFTHLASSRYSSMENINSPYSSLEYQGLSSRWRSSRRSLRSPDSFSREELNESMEAESERLLEEREAELRKRLQSFEEGTAKILTLYEAKSLVALLHIKDCGTLERALVTISSSAAFTQNQDSLREAGCIMRLQHLVIHSDLRVRTAAMRAVANLALNTTNQREMEHIVPLLLGQINDDASEELDDKTTHQILFTLTNVAALTDWHHHFIASLPNLLDLIESSSNPLVSMQALRLLVNLSTNEHMIQYLYSANILSYLWKLMMNPQQVASEDKLLRVVTLLANIVSSSHHTLMSSRQPLAPSASFTNENSSDKEEAFLNPGAGAVASLSHNPSKEEIRQKLNAIAESTSHEDILSKVEQIHRAYNC